PPSGTIGDGYPVDRCDAYRQFAAQCVELARTIDSPRDRAVIRWSGRAWRSMPPRRPLARSALSLLARPQLTASKLSALGEGQKSECASGEARGRRRLGPLLDL